MTDPAELNKAIDELLVRSYLAREGAALADGAGDAARARHLRDKAAELRNDAAALDPARACAAWARHGVN